MTIDNEILKRAVLDLRTFCKDYDFKRINQQIKDIEFDIAIKKKLTDETIKRYEDALNSSHIVSENNKFLAVLFEKRAEILSNDIERLNTFKLEKKLKELIKEKEYIELVLQEINSNNGFEE